MMGEVRCPRCGSRTVILTAKKDDRQYHVCINRPRCRGRVLADDAGGGGWGDDWGRERPALRPAYNRPPQQRRPSPTKGRISIDEAWGDDWGDDRGKGRPAAKPAPYMPQYPRAQKRGLSSGEQNSPKPRRHKAPQVAHEEPQPQKTPKSA